MDLFEVETMRCRAQGSAYSAIDIQWTCTAETGPYFKLGSTEVLCEGYNHADDPYILKGSCGVEYRLILTEEGESKFGYQQPLSKKRREGLPALLFWSVFMVVGFVIVRGLKRQLQQNHREPRRALQGATQGPDDDSDDDPPPPYDGDGYDGGPFAQQPPSSSWKSQSFTQESERGPGQAGSSSSRNGSQLGTAAVAAAAGAAIGAAASQAYRSSTRTRQAEENRWQSNSRTRTTRTWNSGNSHDSSSQSQESTGFGGTTRR